MLLCSALLCCICPCCTQLCGESFSLCASSMHLDPAAQYPVVGKLWAVLRCHTVGFVRQASRLLKPSKKEAEESESTIDWDRGRKEPEVDPFIVLELAVMAGHTSAWHVRSSLFQLMHECARTLASNKVWITNSVSAAHPRTRGRPQDRESPRPNTFRWRLFISRQPMTVCLTTLPVHTHTHTKSAGCADPPDGWDGLLATDHCPRLFPLSLLSLFLSASAICD